MKSTASSVHPIDQSDAIATKKKISPVRSIHQSEEDGPAIQTAVSTNTKECFARENVVLLCITTNINFITKD